MKLLSRCISTRSPQSNSMPRSSPRRRSTRPGGRSRRPRGGGTRGLGLIPGGPRSIWRRGAKRIGPSRVMRIRHARVSTTCRAGRSGGDTAARAARARRRTRDAHWSATRRARAAGRRARPRPGAAPPPGRLLVRAARRRARAARRAPCLHGAGLVGRDLDGHRLGGGAAVACTGDGGRLNRWGCGVCKVWPPPARAPLRSRARKPRARARRRPRYPPPPPCRGSCRRISAGCARASASPRLAERVSHSLGASRPAVPRRKRHRFRGGLPGARRAGGACVAAGAARGGARARP